MTVVCVLVPAMANLILLSQLLQHALWKKDMDLLPSWDLMLKRHILHKYSSLWWLIQIWLSQTIVSEVPTLLTDWKSCCSADPDM